MRTVKPTTNIRCTNAAVPIDAPIRGTPGNRSPELLRAILAQFDVVSNPRYRVRDSNGDGRADTFCNIFLWDATRAGGCEIDHYDQHGRERNANAICSHLFGPEGRSEGWTEMAADIAGSAAARGLFVAAVWHNPGGIGHVALLLPPSGAELRIAQAGRRNLFDAPLAAGFGTHASAVRFFGHG